MIVGLSGAFDECIGICEGLSISLEGLNVLFAKLHNVHLQQLALILPTQCCNILWPDLSSLKYLTLQIDRSIEWKLDSLLPLFSLQTLTIANSNSSHILSLGDSAAVANQVLNTSSLEALTFEGFYYDIELAEGGIEKVCAAMLENKSLQLHTLDINGIPEISDDAANILSTFLLRSKSLFQFKPCGLSVSGAREVAKALHDITMHRSFRLMSKLVIFSVNGPREVANYIELVSEYFEYMDHENMPFFWDIRDEGVKTLSEYLPHDTVISRLIFKGK